jgi:hypothetical protein
MTNWLVTLAKCGMASAATKLPGFVKHAQRALARAKYRMAMVAVLGASALAPGQALAGDAPAVAPHPLRIAFQGDLSAFAFHGMGWGLGIQPADHLRFNFIYFALDNPSFATEKGWFQRLRGGALFDARYYFDPDDKGLSISVAGGNVMSEYTRDGTAGSVAADQVILGPTVGYRAFLHRGLYVEPFLGVLGPLMSYSAGKSAYLGGSVASLGGEDYHAPVPVILFPALVLGYEWGR